MDCQTKLFDKSHKNQLVKLRFKQTIHLMIRLRIKNKSIKENLLEPNELFGQIKLLQIQVSWIK